MTDRIEKTVELRAPVERVWRAITDHREFGQWFQVALDGPFVLGELSTGRITHPAAEGLKWEATVVEIDPPRLFAYTWPHPPGPNDEDYPGAPVTRVEFRLEPVEAGTRLTIVESGFEALPPDRRVQSLRSNEGGWTAQAEYIRAYVEA